ncbi:hypothetical protein RIF29_09427 [Crotalaria pallida]|uniref:Uncharacterized protein n=1 Tax=Crotalaria pallida TaxID=3830 RepID=A0AAN9IHW8_CROPI
MMISSSGAFKEQGGDPWLWWAVGGSEGRSGDEDGAGGDVDSGVDEGDGVNGKLERNDEGEGGGAWRTTMIRQSSIISHQGRDEQCQRSAQEEGAARVDEDGGGGGVGGNADDGGESEVNEVNAAINAVYEEEVMAVVGIGTRDEKEEEVVVYSPCQRKKERKKEKDYVLLDFLQIEIIQQQKKAKEKKKEAY